MSQQVQSQDRLTSAQRDTLIKNIDTFYKGTASSAISVLDYGLLKSFGKDDEEAAVARLRELMAKNREQKAAYLAKNAPATSEPSQ